MSALQTLGVALLLAVLLFLLLVSSLLSWPLTQWRRWRVQRFVRKCEKNAYREWEASRR